MRRTTLTRGPWFFCLTFRTFSSFWVMISTLCYPQGIRCISFHFFEWVIFSILRREYCNLKNDIQAAWYRCSQPFSHMQIGLFFLICNLLSCCTFLVYVMEDGPVPKRARRGTVCDACRKHFASSFGFDKHSRSGYLRFFLMPRSRRWIHPHPIGGHITADHVDSHAAKTEALSTKQQYH